MRVWHLKAIDGTDTKGASLSPLLPGVEKLVRSYITFSVTFGEEVELTVEPEEDTLVDEVSPSVPGG